MMNRKIFPLLVLCGLALWAVPQASATCTSSWPPFNFELMVGQSICLSVCPDGEYPPLLLKGNRSGSQYLPHLIFEPGCGPTTRCNTDPTCPPLCVPQWPFTPGGDPYDYCPGGYYGHTECVEFVVCFEHDQFWSLTVLTVTHGGCFCLTYDYQLAVNMRSGLVAVGGNNEVSLSWATASETDNARFDIFRGDDRVGSVPGMGQSSVEHNYTWTDNNVQNGVAYSYTLKAVDMSGGVTDVGTASATPRAPTSGAVTEYKLYQNYPNPFNPTTSIAFDVVEASNVTLKVFNPMGSEVATLVHGPVSSGSHSVMFNAADFSSGLYFYTIQIGDRFTATRKMLLVK